MKRSISQAIVLALPIVAVIEMPARAQTGTTITFDDQPVGTIVTTQYSAQGLGANFDAYVIVTHDVANPQNHTLAVTASGEFNSNVLTVTFLSPQHLVTLNGSFRANTGNNVGPEMLVALDAGRNVVAQTGSVMVTGGSFTQEFSVSTTTDIISSVELHAGTGADAEIDNLHFEGEAAPGNTGGAPVVTILTPPLTPTTNAPTVVLTGTVAGTNLFSLANVALDFQAPPGQPTHIDQPVQLTATSDPNVFTFLANIQLPPALVTITVTAQTVFGIQASAFTVAVNLPPDLFAFCTLQPSGSKPIFQYAIQQGSCTMVVCQTVATISSPNVSQFGIGFLTSPTTSEFELSSTFLAKWLSVQDQPRLGVTRNLGCPTGPAVTVGPLLPPPASTPLRQSFENGRIYEDQTGNAFYVPGVFSHAIDVGGDDLAVGVPVADPSIGLVVQDVDTIWYQHFTRSIANDPKDLGTTMELRNSPAVLSVERQGGDFHEYVAAGLTPASSAATIWEKYTCIGTGPWTCNVPPPAQHVAVSNTSQIDAQCGPVSTPLLDGVNTYPFSGAMEWAPAGAPSPASFSPFNYQYQEVKGWIKSGGSFRSAEDNPITHECYDALDPPWPSDWNIHLRPFPQFDNLLGDNFANLDFELETEFCDLSWFFEGTDFPREGDLFYTKGRWIVDCGHFPFNTEIHPQAVMSLARTASMKPVVGVDLPGTFQPILVDGFFTGGPTTISIYPPPRPSPDAYIEVLASVGPGAVFGGVQQAVNLFSDHVEMTFSGGPGTQPALSAAGEMFNRQGFGFEGVVYVFWVN